jgi:hypothetical protein
MVAGGVARVHRQSRFLRAQPELNLCGKDRIEYTHQKIRVPNPYPPGWNTGCWQLGEKYEKKEEKVGIMWDTETKKGRKRKKI